MRHGIMLKVAAVAVCAVVGMVGAPACDMLGLGGDGSSGGSGGSGLDALGEADPMEIALAELKAEYTAYTIQGMIEENVADPNAVDDATLQAMADQYASDAEAKAEQWVQSLDPSTIPQFKEDLDKQEACIDKFGCEPSETCTFSVGKAICPLVSCGSGKCPTCPNIFNMSGALVTGWCAHVCLRGAPARVVGYKAVIHFRTGGTWRYCYEAANQN